MPSVPFDDELFHRAHAMAATGRVVLGITGAPGAGKTTLAERLVEQFGADAVVVPMDGFHLHDDELARLERGHAKGAPDTFDVAGYVSLLRRLRTEADEETRLERLVERHAAHGKPRDLAERWASDSDQANAELVASTRERADLVVRVG